MTLFLRGSTDPHSPGFQLQRRDDSASSLQATVCPYSTMLLQLHPLSFDGKGQTRGQGQASQGLRSRYWSDSSSLPDFFPGNTLIDPQLLCLAA